MVRDVRDSENSTDEVCNVSSFDKPYKPVHDEFLKKAKFGKPGCSNPQTVPIQVIDAVIPIPNMLVIKNM